MFSADPAAVGEIALALSESFDEPDLPSVRVGVAAGPVIAQGGDLSAPSSTSPRGHHGRPARFGTDLGHPGRRIAGGRALPRLADPPPPPQGHRPRAAVVTAPDH